MALILLFCVFLPLLTTAMEYRYGVNCSNLFHILNLKGDFRPESVIHQLGMLRKDRTLYYIFEPENVDLKDYDVGFINLNNPSKFGILSTPTEELNIGCVDVDQANNVIYLGGSDGVMTLDPSNGHVSRFSSAGQTILSLSVKDNVYFVRENEYEIVYKKGRDIKPLLQDDKNKAHSEHLPKIAVKKFVVAKYNTVVFLSEQGLFAAKIDKNSKPHRLSNNALFRGFAVDLHGDVFTWSTDGIYKVVLNEIPANNAVVRIADVPNIGALTFDNDNSILLTVGKSLFRFVKNNKQCQ